MDDHEMTQLSFDVGGEAWHPTSRH
jgi:hypothetical protein